MGCCQLKNYFPPGDNFGEKYNEYLKLHENVIKFEKLLHDEVEVYKEKKNFNLKYYSSLINLQEERERAFLQLKQLYSEQCRNNKLDGLADLKLSIIEELDKFYSQGNEKEMDLKNEKILNNV